MTKTAQMIKVDFVLPWDSSNATSRSDNVTIMTIGPSWVFQLFLIIGMVTSTIQHVDDAEEDIEGRLSYPGRALHG